MALDGFEKVWNDWVGEVFNGVDEDAEKERVRERVGEHFQVSNRHIEPKKAAATYSHTKHQ